MAKLRDGQPIAPAPVAENPTDFCSNMMPVHEQAEADRLRVAWMAEIGNDPHDIEASLRHNQPQSVAEERALLDVVRKIREMERTNDEMMGYPHNRQFWCHEWMADCGSINRPAVSWS